MVAMSLAEHVALDGVGQIVHGPDATRLPSTLPEITDAIYARIDAFVLEIGALLHHAFTNHRAVYDDWVETQLPFGLDKARRMRMIYVAYRELPTETLARLPAPWQSLYALTRIDRPALEAAIEDGTVHPDLTVRETCEVVAGLNGRETKRHTEADLVAAKLASLPPESLTPPARDLLQQWLGQSRAQPQPPHSSAS